MKRLLSQIISAILGLWLAVLFVPEVIIRTYPQSNFFDFPLTNQWELIILLGIVLGLMNYFLKPILKTLSLPLEILTLGLFTLVINMGLIWLLDLMFDELYIPLFLPLIYTSLIIWGLNIIIGLILIKKYK
ncbi:MAG: phage holin family protein [Candidatus Staskawiczbacteria bacterium]